METPDFIYAFGALGPGRFAELCGKALKAHFPGLLLGGVGADGGIDAQTDKVFGKWQSQSRDELLVNVAEPDQDIIFQYKHKVVARVGAISVRRELLKEYRCSKKKKCELHSDLVQKNKPDSYILLTNVEVNPVFRDKFIDQCKAEEPGIQHYQIIGLDDLISWIEDIPELRQAYFPTLFVVPRFNLRVNVHHEFELQGPHDQALLIDVMNVGSASSHIGGSSIKFCFLLAGKQEVAGYLLDNNPLRYMNSGSGITIEPGRKYTYILPTTYFAALKKYIEKRFNTDERILPVEIQICDDIGNTYRDRLEEDQKNMILKWMYG